MRKKLPLLFGAVFLVLGMAACEGPAGPAGPAGQQGATGSQGPQGPAGPAGEDALNTCSDCHTSDVTIVAREVQYNNSVHGTGTTFERSDEPCNTCHTHQGFVAANAATPDTLAGSDIENPTRINCRTCHNIHETYTEADWAFTTTDPVDLYVGGTFDINALNAEPDPVVEHFDGANLCAHCHQARDPGDLSGATAQITSTHYGMHHGPQSNVLSGQGAFSLPGVTVPAQTDFDAHTQFGCVGCHMQDAYGAQAGGHTWSMTYALHGDEAILNDGRCNTCHSDNPEGDYGYMAKIDALLGDVATALQAHGALDASGTPVPGTYDVNVVKAFLNYDLILEDRSHGVHNPIWAQRVLEATLGYLQAN